MKRRTFLSRSLVGLGGALLNFSRAPAVELPQPSAVGLGCERNNVTVRGTGAPIIFSHGFMMDRSMFEPQLQALSAKYCAIAYDSRARTAHWQGPYDLYDLADDCLRLMDRLGIERSVIAGMSMGGWMALRLTLHHPDRVAGLVLIDTTATADDAARRAQFVGIFEKLIGQQALPAEFVDWVTPQMFGNTTLAQNSALVAPWRAKFLTYAGSAVYAEAMSFRSRDDVSHLLGRIKVPALIVQGEEDKPVPLKLAEELHAGLSSSSLLRVPRAGHTSNLENPDVVTAGIEDLMKSVYSG